MLEKIPQPTISEMTNEPAPARLLPAPVVRELPADLETPVSVYLKLSGQGPSFLLESVTGGEQVARYSFIGMQPSRAYVLRGRSIECRSKDQRQEIALAAGNGPAGRPAGGARPLPLGGCPRAAAFRGRAGRLPEL